MKVEFHAIAAGDLVGKEGTFLLATQFCLATVCEIRHAHGCDSRIEIETCDDFVVDLKTTDQVLVINFV